MDEPNDDLCRYRLLKVACPMLAGFWKEVGSLLPYAIDDNPLPVDARIVGVWMDWPRDVVVFKVESAEFPGVPEGSPIPDHGDIRFRCVDAVKATEAEASRN